jgi:XTP/dITP diphosphohydrolase
MSESRRKEKFPLKGKVVFFATGNIHKFNEARSMLSKLGIAVGMLKVKGTEIQSDSLVEIAKRSAREAFKQCGLPVFVEDAGLFLNALKGFPGPYAAYVYKTLGNKDLLKLMEGVKDRKAVFRSAIAYYDGEAEAPVVFEGEAEGEVTVNERHGSSKSGFGFDPIFKPSGSIKTFAQMSLEEKNGFSHRAKAICKFADWYKTLQ